MFHNANEGDLPIEGERVLLFYRNDYFKWAFFRPAIGTYQYDDELSLPFFTTSAGRDIPVGRFGETGSHFSVRWQELEFPGEERINELDS